MASPHGRFALKALAVSVMLSFGASSYAAPAGGVVFPALEAARHLLLVHDTVRPGRYEAGVETAVAGEFDGGRRHRDRPGEQIAIHRNRQAGCEVASVGRCRQHHLLVAGRMGGEELRQEGRPCADGERSGLDGGDVAGETSAGRCGNGRSTADDQHLTVAFGNGFQAAGRQHTITNGKHSKHRVQDRRCRAAPGSGPEMN